MQVKENLRMAKKLQDYEERRKELDAMETSARQEQEEKAAQRLEAEEQIRKTWQVQKDLTEVNRKVEALF